MKIRLVLPTASLLLLSGVFLPVTSFGAELKPSVSPETMAKRLIEEGLIKRWIRIGKVDIDRDGDLDKVMTSDYSDSRGNSLWKVYFNEGGEFFYTKNRSFSARSGMMGAGKLKEFDGNWGIVSYAKGSARTGVVHGVWFEKTGEREVKKHEKNLFRVDVGHKSDTREEHKARIDEIFSRADEDPFEEVKHYTVEEFIEEHGLEIDGEGEGSSESE